MVFKRLPEEVNFLSHDSTVLVVSSVAYAIGGSDGKSAFSSSLFGTLNVDVYFTFAAYSFQL